MQKRTIKEYLTGKGIQFSLRSSFSSIPVKDSPLDNLFRIEQPNQETYDFIYTENLIETTKYDRILYQESLIGLRKEGLFIVNLGTLPKPEQKHIEKEILLVGKGKYVLSETLHEQGSTFLLFQKTENYLKESDSVDKWTFGIITNGTRDDFIETFIRSIEKQKIPAYEVLICGKLKDETLTERYKNTKLIFFDQKSDKGWITRKKNIVYEEAQYENVMLVHDRFYLDDNWFEGMKRYGNYFEVLACKQTFEDYVMGWTVYRGHANNTMDFFGEIQIVDKLDASDWSPKVVTHNGVSIMKKSVWSKAKWDEERFWNEKDDVDLSFRQYDNGIMTRYNPYGELQISYSRVGLHHLTLRKNSRRDDWMRWSGPIKEQLFYRMYLLRQYLFCMVFLIFRKNLFSTSFKKK